jgi:hypothetical protein
LNNNNNNNNNNGAMTTTTTRRRIDLPDDVAGLLAAFDLTLDGLLTVNPKVAKTAAAGIARSVIHHAKPSRSLARAIDPRNDNATATRGFLPSLRALAERNGMVSAAVAHNGCMHATAGCIGCCLEQSGHGGLSVKVSTARGRRTMAMVADPVAYGRAMVYALARETARARRDGLPLAARLCGTDETPWFRRLFPVSVADAQRIRRRFGVHVSVGDRLNVAAAFGDVADFKLYEYLKARTNDADGLIAWRAAGWHDVTASFAADRSTAVRDAVHAIRAGFRVAFPVMLDKRAAPLRSLTLRPDDGVAVTIPAVDGDATDARWLDPALSGVVLRYKRSRGADPAAVAAFVLPDRPVVRLSDGVVQLNR